MEAEIRAILTRASLEVGQRESAQALQSWVAELYGRNKPTDVVDALITERRREASSD